MDTMSEQQDLSNKMLRDMQRIQQNIANLAYISQIIEDVNGNSIKSVNLSTIEEGNTRQCPQSILGSIIYNVITKEAEESLAKKRKFEQTDDSSTL